MLAILFIKKNKNKKTLSLIPTKCSPRREPTRSRGPKADAPGEQRLYPFGLIPQGRYCSTIAEKVNAGYDDKVSELALHCRLLYMRVGTCRPVRAPMLTNC